MRLKSITFSFLSLGLICSLLMCAQAQKTNAGQPLAAFSAHLSEGWYPGQPEALNKALKLLDEKSAQKFAAKVASNSIRALIVPHASYQYSGTVAAAVYRLAQSSTIRRVIILAPSHSKSFRGVALPQSESYRIPSGYLKIDANSIQKLSQNQLFTYDNDVFASEHAIEIQLPMVKRYLPNAAIVPLIVGSLSQDNIKNVAATIKPLIDTATLVIVSSDFTHYGQRFHFSPFLDHEQLRIKQLDAGAIEAIEQFSLANFMSYVDKTRMTICGKIPIAILLGMIEDKAFAQMEPRLIGYQTSAAYTHENTDSVSYVGLLFTTEKRVSLPKNDQLTMYEKSDLLTTARSTLEQLFSKNISPALLRPVLTPALINHSGAFVTLTKKGKLRGCIGRTSSNEPLYQTVMDMTKAAAFEDSRFTPVTKDELASITIEISVLTKPAPIKGYQNIALGQHGIILQQGGKSAVFLPKVATEFAWDLPTTLKHLSTKAGLPADAWRSPTTSFKVFESIDFAE